MSGVICFKSESEQAWVMAGWAYRQVLEDTLALCPGDSGMVEELAIAKDAGYLYVDRLEPSLGLRITEAMRRMIEGIRAGNLRTCLADKAYGTEETTKQYVESLSELFLIIPPRQE